MKQNGMPRGFAAASLLCCCACFAAVPPASRILG